MSPSGKAVDFDSAIRRFESCHPSFYNPLYSFKFFDRLNIERRVENFFLLNKKTMTAHIQFIKGIDEKVLPDIRLTRSRYGSTGSATFRFKNANILDKSLALNGEITGMYMIDKEGVLETRDVSARFVNGKPQAVESIYIMKSAEAWDRFMRFMERYGESNGLVFTKA